MIRVKVTSTLKLVQLVQNNKTLVKLVKKKVLIWLELLYFTHVCSKGSKKAIRLCSLALIQHKFKDEDQRWSFMSLSISAEPDVAL